MGSLHDFGPPEEAVCAAQTFLCVAHNLVEWVPTGGPVLSVSRVSRSLESPMP